ncbi:DUF853 family protein [Leptolyngbya sp. 15MV]|nr:DUF853 family protein [Leptolyngbya sp. 15MV]
MLIHAPLAARDVPVDSHLAFQRAVAAARPGDRILLADGEWRDVELVISGNGRAGKPITVTARTPGNVIITGRSNLRISGSHLVISGLVFRGGHSPVKELISFRTSARDVATNVRLTEVVIDGFVVQRTLIRPPWSRLGPLTPKERAIIQSVSPLEGKYDTPVDRESAAEVLAAKALDAAATAEEVAAQGREAVGQRARRTTSLWERAGKAAMGAAASSAATIVAAKMTGRSSRANPMKTAATSAAGTIATEFGGGIAGRFVRNLIGGLMR